MDQAKRKELEERRTNKQLFHKLQEFVSTDIAPALELLNHLQESGSAYKIVRLVNIPREWEPHLFEILSSPKYAAYRFESIPTSFENKLVMEVLDSYPTTNPFRYVPDLPRFENSNSSVKQIAETLMLEDQEVYLYYFSYALIIQVSLFELLNINTELLFNWWDGDTIIFPSDKKWLIAYSLEEEWYAGKAEM